MSDLKLSSEEVPKKFAEWLLAMGCPSEKVPSSDKVAQMCRGQYYMVWRSLMEHVHPKDIIRNKRMQVFCDDVRRCQNTRVFNERNSNVVTPQELVIWREQQEMTEQVAAVEARVTEMKCGLEQLTERNSSKLYQRNIMRGKVEDLQRRAFLLQQVTEDLRAKRNNLVETRGIADSLCHVDEETDVQNKLDKCVNILRRHGNQQASMSMCTGNPVASSSIVSTTSETSDNDEHLASLVKSRGDILWSQLYERRAALVSLCDRHALDSSSNKTIGLTPRSVLAHTAALHCTMSLDALKQKALLLQTQEKLEHVITTLNNYQSSEACELFVLRCERAKTEARIKMLRELSQEIAQQTCDVTNEHTCKHLAPVDREIETKRDELKRMIASMAATERKIQNVRECLEAVFHSFHSGNNEFERLRGVQLDLPSESIYNLRQFFEERRECRQNRVDLSMEMDASDCSIGDIKDISNPRFTDELKLYKSKFNLERNRKLVLESGEKIWSFETLQSSLTRLLTRWQHEDVTSSLLCPSVCLSRNIRALIEKVEAKEQLTRKAKDLKAAVCIGRVIDISAKTQEEERNTDKIKKRLNDNILSLQKTEKSLELGSENLKFWGENNFKEYILPNRIVDGKPYKEYEAIYLDIISLGV